MIGKDNMLWILILSVILFILGFCLLYKVMKDIPNHNVNGNLLFISAVFLMVGANGIAYAIADML